MFPYLFREMFDIYLAGVRHAARIYDYLFVRVDKFLKSLGNIEIMPVFRFLFVYKPFGLYSLFLQEFQVCPFEFYELHRKVYHHGHYAACHEFNHCQLLRILCVLKSLACSISLSTLFNKSITIRLSRFVMAFVLAFTSFASILYQYRKRVNFRQPLFCQIIVL